MQSEKDVRVRSWAVAAVIAIVGAMIVAVSLLGRLHAAADQQLVPATRRMATDQAERWFGAEKFGGNGRTCATCHRPQDGFSTTPASAQARLAADPNDPLFRPVDSDDGKSRVYTRLLTHATVRVRIPLRCRNIWPEDDPHATSIIVNRAIPGLIDTPALDPILMSDGRAASLEQQATDAIHYHAEADEDPDPEAVRQIAEFQIGDRFFSSDALRQYAHRGNAPPLPSGNTPEEQRGRVHFLPTGMCGRCHSGPMLNTTSSTSVLGPGHRFASIRAGELVPKQRINPFVKWHLINNNYTERVFFDFADPGRILITCRREDLTNFKIRSLW